MVRACSFLGVLAVAGACAAQQYLISTVAGGNPPSTPVSATKASIGDPPRVAVDAAGNLYFGGLHSVFRVDRNGTLTRLAGNGRKGYSGDGGPAVNAQLSYPDGIAVDSAGNLYVADRDAAVIRRVAPDGTISTVAGTGFAGYAGDRGAAAGSQLNVPMGLALDASGNLYVADSANHRVRRIARDLTISTVAGNGIAGYAGDGDAAVNAELNQPEGVAVDAAGNLYIADTVNDRIRKVTPTGTISTVAGTGLSAVFASIYDGTGVSITTGDNGPAAAAAVVLPTDVAVDGAGSLYIADYGNGRIRVVAKGIITTAAGRSDGIKMTEGQAADSVALTGPTGLAVDTSGTIYFAEGSVGTGSGMSPGDFKIWKVTTGGLLAAVAGTGLESYAGDGGAASTAQLGGPAQMAMDASGALYLADSRNHRVRRIAPDGTIRTIAGTGVAGYAGDGGLALNAQLNGPLGVAVDTLGNVFIADTINNRVRKVTTDGKIVTWVGNGNGSFFGDEGFAWFASVHAPRALAVDAAGSIFIADTLNQRIRKVTPDGYIHTIAGSGISGFSGDGGDATKARLNQPGGLTLDAAGNLYIADTGNANVRKLSVAGTISTLATSGSFSAPRGLAFDPAGNLYVTDTGKILKLGTDGTFTTFAGNGQCCYSGDGGAPSSAALDAPWGIVADASGAVLFTDFNNDAIRAIEPATSVPTIRALTNGASNQVGAIAPGELVVIFGSSLGPSQLVQAPTGTTVATQLAGVSVLFNGVAGQLLYASSTQVSAVVPSSVSGSSVLVALQNKLLTAAAVTVPLVNAAPALFTHDGSGTGQAAALNADGTPNDAGRPATAGGTIVVFATGTGGQAITVTIGGKPAAVLATSSGNPGVVQISVQVPAGLSGGAVPIAVQAGGVSSAAGITVAVS